jgi:alpha-N-acetylglucosaminidase
MIVKGFLAAALLCFSLPSHAQSEVQPAQQVLQRLMPRLAPQIHLALAIVDSNKDAFRISGTTGDIKVEAGTIPALLFGVNWYLKYTAHLQVSTNGLQLGAKDLRLPAPPQSIEGKSPYPWRYALNENVDGYSSPYWDQTRWQREIDILAMSGINAVLIERGTDYILYETYRDAGYSDEAIRRWITQPAHQNWQLMGNMCCFNEPISLEILKKRAESAKQIIASLRSLGIAPVLPGYYGIVPGDFASTHPGAHVIPQGEWNGFTRPGWLDPRDPQFAKLAAIFYKHQQDLFGPAPMYDINIFQEGGRAGDVPVGDGARAVQKALHSAHPIALWFMMAWQKEPEPALLSAIDTSRVLIADIEQGRIPREHRDEEFHGAGWLYGGLWEFGGRTTFGAPLYDYAVRFPEMAKRSGSRIKGIALFTEGVDTNPFAFDLYTEMAWRTEPVDLPSWTKDYATRRYGADDAHAQRAWQIILKTAYGYRADGVTGHGERDAAADSVFNAQPSLEALRASSASSDALRYKPADLAPALTELLQVAPPVRMAETYKYDLVDVGRQVLANSARDLLPQIKAAYESKNRGAFDSLTGQWLHRMQLEDDLLRTDSAFLLGRWLGYVPQWSSSPAELEKLNYDARSILTTWGDRKASEDGGLHEYGNKDWSGLVDDYYRVRWQMYFDSLRAAMISGKPAKPIDWYAFGDRWNHQTKTYPALALGDPYEAAARVARELKLAP